ncbi:hypothetical protein ACFX2I_003724 [Malus domestica]
MIQEKNRLLLIAQVDVESVPIESEDDSVDAAVLHGVAAETERREAGEGGDVLEDSGAEKETPEAITQVSKRRKTVVVETSDSDHASPPKTKRLIPTRKSKRTRTVQTLKSPDLPAPVSDAGRKKQKSSRPQASKKPTIASKEEPLGAEMYKKAEKLRNITLKELEAARAEKLRPPEVSSPLARETSFSLPRVNLSEVGVSAPGQGSPLISPSVLEATPYSQFDPSTGVMLHFVDEDINLPSSIQPPSVATCDEPIVPEIPVTSEATILQVFACPIVTLDEPPSFPQGRTQGIGEGSSVVFSSPVSGRESSSQPGICTFPCEAPGLIQQVLEEASPFHLVRKSKLPWPHLTIGIAAISHPGIEKAGETKTAPSVGTTSLEETGVQNPSPASPFSKTAKLPELFEEFGQLETRLKSSKHSSPSGFPEQQRVFQEWARRDFSASFSLKALCDLEKVTNELFKAGQLSKTQHDSFLSFFENLRALRDQHKRAERQANRLKALCDLEKVTNELFKAGQLSKTQHDSFLSFFENLRALRDQHKRAERQANRVRCFQEKESSTSAQVERLMYDGSLTKERIGVVTSEIRKLEE